MSGPANTARADLAPSDPRASVDVASTNNQSLIDDSPSLSKVTEDHHKVLEGLRISFGDAIDTTALLDFRSN